MSTNTVLFICTIIILNEMKLQNLLINKSCHLQIAKQRKFIKWKNNVYTQLYKRFFLLNILLEILLRIFTCSIQYRCNFCCRLKTTNYNIHLKFKTNPKLFWYINLMTQYPNKLESLKLLYFVVNIISNCKVPSYV